MGGGLELALHCHVPDAVRRRAGGRAARGASSAWSPAGAARQLLPNLIGADNAVTVIIENALNQNRMLQGQAGLRPRHRRRAVRAGRLPRASRWPGPSAVVRGEIVVERPGGRPRRGLGRGAGPRPRASPTRGCTARPRRRTGRWSCSTLARTATCDDGLRRRGRGARRPGHERRAARRALRLRPGAAAGQAAGRRAGQVAWPAPVTKVGVVGAGLMAGQLALLFARRLEVPVVLTDLDQARRRQGRRLRARRDRQAARQGPDQPGQGQPAQGAGHRLD